MSEAKRPAGKDKSSAWFFGGKKPRSQALPSLLIASAIEILDVYYFYASGALSRTIRQDPFTLAIFPAISSASFSF
jgi:hypothetical protein